MDIMSLLTLKNIAAVTDKTYRQFAAECGQRERCGPSIQEQNTLICVSEIRNSNLSYLMLLVCYKEGHSVGRYFHSSKHQIVVIGRPSETCNTSGEVCSLKMKLKVDKDAAVFLT